MNARAQRPNPGRRPGLRFTMREMMVLVAIVAVLMPQSPEDASFPVLFAVLWVSFALIGAVLACGFFVRPVRVAIVAVITGIIVLVFSPLAWIHQRREFFAIEWVVLVLTPLHVTGLFAVAWRLSQHLAVASGEILWGWQSAIWSFFVTFWGARAGQLGSVLLLAWCARLTIVAALVLALYGPRPSEPRRQWGHGIGWALAQCDAIVWGCCAWGWLR